MTDTITSSDIERIQRLGEELTSAVGAVAEVLAVQDERPPYTRLLSRIADSLESIAESHSLLACTAVVEIMASGHAEEITEPEYVAIADQVREVWPADVRRFLSGRLPFDEMEHS